MHKLPDSHPFPPGRERALFRMLPSLLIGGLAVPAIFALLVMYFDPAWQVGLFIAAGIAMVDVLAVITMAVGCVLVIVMKGDAWGADDYPLPDDTEPRQRR
ncbi:hypothetical protein [Lacisediminimonas profundi]|uniref:hypothetical protein n=1 Tax=Lacisediminimonas profundi TaxID=2603856 RepID=UPI00124B44F9|nr:hypothetical protein [Lacisediminimonas profundi]